MKKNKVIKITGNIIFYGLFIFLLFISYTMFQAKQSGIQPTVFGYKMYTILTGSMEPAIQVGDVVIVKEVPLESIQLKDVITFGNTSSNNVTTHRVVDINKTSTLQFVTQGDANNVKDPVPVGQDLVVGKVVSKVPYLGNVFLFLQQKLYFIIGGVVFVFLLFFLPRKKKVKQEDEKEGQTVL